MKLVIEMDNQAFEGQESKEVARILNQFISDIKGDSFDSDYYLNLYDLNGNKVGFAKVE